MVKAPLIAINEEYFTSFKELILTREHSRRKVA